ncbi:cystatin-A5-like [Fundulus heteroclitus]|uniref:cystatin-A5-like n=1 Tax=Fundulus heteroclitus TaxID=8078 RepID=UPI00165C9791|nr:cystatin-A5-like [Fundulus heteroclitus]
MEIPGGWSETIPATDKIQGICSVMKSNVEDITKTSYWKFGAIIYREQIVEGKNYLIRVDIGEEKMIDLMVYEPLPQRTPKGFWKIEFELMGIKQNRTQDDPFEPFD